MIAWFSVMPARVFSPTSRGSMPASNAVPNCASNPKSGGAKPDAAQSAGLLRAESQALGQAANDKFAGGVDSRLWPRQVGSHRGDVHDMPARSQRFHAGDECH